MRVFIFDILKTKLNLGGYNLVFKYYDVTKFV